MPIDPVTLAVFGFSCPSCKQDFRKSLVELILNTFPCPGCGVDITVSDYYGRAELEEFIMGTGRKWAHLGAVK